MSASGNSSPTWRPISGSTSAFQSVGGAIEATIDLACTFDGLAIQLPATNSAERSATGLSASAAPMHVLGIASGVDSESNRARVDGYVRGCDLVATYEGVAPHPLRLQAYLAALAPAEFASEFASEILGAFDLIVSVNTSLLDDDPRSAVCGAIPSGSAAFESRPGQFAVVIGQSDLCWLEMIHPSDYCHSEAKRFSSQATEVGIRHELFRQRLEKGVILRARVRGGLIRRQQSDAIAAAAFERFAATEPPLTV